MDSHNLFATKTTYRLLRLEYAAALVSAAVLIVMHLDHVRWWAFAALFVYIDVIGSLPGAIAWRRSPDGRISRVYYVLYNTAHSLLSAAANWQESQLLRAGRLKTYYGVTTFAEVIAADREMKWPDAALVKRVGNALARRSDGLVTRVGNDGLPSWIIRVSTP